MGEIKKIRVTERTTRKVIVEKCPKGRSMSKSFVKRIEVFHPDIHSKFDRLETQMEGDLIESLSIVGIYAMMKSDKRSLPYTNSIVQKFMLESNINVTFDFRRTYRKIFSELLEKDVRKIRFYVHIESYDDYKHPFNFCGISYDFRYYIH